MPKPSKPSSHPLKDEGVPAAPVKQHHAMALGQRKTGSSDPYGAQTASTEVKVTNSQGKTC
jgi:hypothetical protein